ncbi:hypothetical protein AB751O23_AL_00200 [Chlamydiales bacterium SCGC AB-751-O23]|jgi:hypothetical protein|nr:hypothetical protein AB751O23_AL_00200 [Chlamydiales bacterium SCGC AB-751-O23]
MEHLSDYLTIEALIEKEKFQDNFQLCNYAIQQVQNVVNVGNDNFDENEIQNKAYNILDGILHDRDFAEEFAESEGSADYQNSSEGN